MQDIPSLETAYASSLSRWPWQTHAVLRLPDTLSSTEVHRLVTSQLIRPLARITGSRVGGIGFLIRSPRPHIHALLLSARTDLSALDSSTPEGRDLLRTLQTRGPNRLGFAEPGQLVIRPLHSLGGVRYAIEANHLAGHDDGGILYFDRRLLNRLCGRPQQPPADIFFGPLAHGQAA